MTRAEAYWVLHEMMVETFSADQSKALSIALNDIQFVDLMPDDTVPVVRCKDCKRSKNAFDGLFCDHALPTKRLEEIIFCGTTVLSRVKPDDFCSYGERRGDGV